MPKKRGDGESFLPCQSTKKEEEKEGRATLRRTKKRRRGFQAGRDEADGGGRKCAKEKDEALAVTPKS